MTTENNKLIAEFMGMTCDDNDKSMMIVKTTQGNDIIYLDELKYHTSWDWLMPVVIKISGSANGVLRTIKDTHQAVVEFIKKYNN